MRAFRYALELLTRTDPMREAGPVHVHYLLASLSAVLVSKSEAS